MTVDDLAARYRRTVADVQNAVAAHYGDSVAALVSRSQHQPLTLHRQVAMYLARKTTRASNPKIGQRFNGRDPSTVWHAVNKVEQRRLTDPQLDADIRALEAQL